MEPQKHQYIDSLRGIAILLVLLVHNLYLGTGSSFFPPLVLEIFNDGEFGVQLFFVVSAYTLMASFYTRKAETNATRNFFIRRFFRIAPMYYLAILYFSFQGYIGFHFFSTGHVLQPMSYGRLFSNLTFLHGFNPSWMNTFVPGGWSIAVEMTFYLTLPLICRHIKNMNGALLLVIVSMVLSTLLESVLNTTYLHSNNYLYYFFPTQLPVFGLGILAYFIISKPPVAPRPYVLVLLGALLVFYRYTPFILHLPYGIVFCILLIALARRPYKLFVNRFFSSVGKVSFSMYLVHFAMMHWMVYFGFNNLIEISNLNSALAAFGCRYIILFGSSFFVSFLTYKLIELPFQKAGALLIEKLKSGDLLKRRSKSLILQGGSLSKSLDSKV